MNWKHHQRMVSDSEDELLLQEEDPDLSNHLAQDEVDPLDAFMDQLQQENPPELPPSRIPAPIRTLFDEDNRASEEEHEECGVAAERVERRSSDQILSNEAEEAVSAKREKKIIESLKPVDFSEVQLQDFEKHFYSQHPEISAMSVQEVKKFMKELEIKCSGAEPPRPIVSFGHLQLPELITRQLTKQNFEKPTPIQAIALPAVLSGRDVVGIAKTGSGKTLAYLLPLIVHVAARPAAEKGDGPCAIVLGPTRELCQQIYMELKKYSKKYDFRISCLLGGENKHDQWKTLKAGIDVLIASPGRLIEMLKKKATSLLRVTYLVLDEADRMLSLGFEQQIRSIVGQTREDRQTLLFTATMKKQMQFLVNDIILSPVRIHVGEEGAANEDVLQDVVVVESKEAKLQWIIRHFNDLLVEGKVLVFANQRETCEQLATFIEQRLGIPALALHGDKNQYDRTIIMNSFKKDSQVLVATDIAARGIDVKNIKTVVNFECPKQIEAYIHRIGRAGRAGETGKAYSFLTNYDVKFAIALVKTFENSGYPVPQELEDLACLDDFFKRKRLSSKMGVSFAKGKDASKFLTQILKKQRMGFSRAGLGMEDPKEKRGRGFPSQSSQNILSGEQNTRDMSFAEIGSLIRQKLKDRQGREQKFGRFVLSEGGPLSEAYSEPTITYPKREQK